MKSQVLVCAVGALVASSLAGRASAGLTFLTGAAALNGAANLVNNGSFEIGAPALGSQIFWANPAFPGNTVPAGWSASGASQTYATWGSDVAGPTGVRGSDPLPHGQSGLYFGNGLTDVSVAPVFQADGRVNFSSLPAFTPTFGGPVVLSQSINTPSSPSALYRISFWVSGEDSGQTGNGFRRGVLGFRATNVLAGDPIQYLTVPNNVISPHSRVFTYEFSPINASLPVDISFINWGHIDTVGGVGTGALTTELVLDNVIINTVPGPGAGMLLSLGGAAALRRRRVR